MKKGLFITFEGTDGVGKSTQLRLCSEYLASQGYDVVVTREPGGCKISEQIRSIILDIENGSMSAQCEALLYAAARAQHMSEVILPALAEGKIIICDRFYDSSVAYQGFGRMLGKDMIRDINKPAMFGQLPDLTILLSLSPEKAFDRKHGEKDDRIETSGDDFFKRVYEGFADAAQAEPERICVIDAGGEKEATHAKVRTAIDRLLDENR